MGQIKNIKLHIVTDIKKKKHRQMSASRERLLGDYQSPATDVNYNTYDTFVSVRRKRLCGPKLSNCCFVLSIWGLVMLLIMGLLFRMESVALLEDLPEAETNETISEPYQ